MATPEAPVRLHTSFRIPVDDAPAVSWRATPEAAAAHAFRESGPGWSRSVCRKEPWTVRHRPADELVSRCVDCVLLVDGAPGEITEAYGS